ncbi:MAG: glycosyltransferase family 4 protein [Leptolyngbyaceae cyanobacterium RM2_2_4]|nr:glycosyltransferase family 4 protein [Leptolyngbyaceae cyanobacterium SM1_4_3]NJN89266.1 glycosyltransferase family 4 protein [Leptolyngbyaceae cyanobacterium SL_5_14]NJO51688.1 glycosyltransferase family 4 protein [Leptolyngbyaceae cyanobacterium RM2_2_4]
MRLNLSTQVEPSVETDNAESSKHPSPLKVVTVPYYLNENPYQKQLHVHLSDLGIQVSGLEGGIYMPAEVEHINPNILHLHWLQVFSRSPNFIRSFLRLLKFMAGLLVLKWSGVKIVWTAHNLKDHENTNPVLDQLCRSFVIQLSDAIIAHGEVAKQEILNNFRVSRENKIFVIPHGNYVGYYPNEITQAKARKQLEINDSKIVFLFLGMIRPYKGVNELIDIFKQLHQDDVELIIAGKPLNPNIETEINQKIQGHANIKFKPGFVPNEEIQVYMNACDVVVFPYRNLLTSGAAILAMSFGKACLAPKIGCLKEVLDDSGAFLYDPDAPNLLLQTINQAIEQRADLGTMGEYNRQVVEQWSWDRIAQMTGEVYQKCLEP